mgnify:CR=1 FL=1
MSMSRTGCRRVKEPGRIRLYFFFCLQIFTTTTSSVSNAGKSGTETWILPKRKRNLEADTALEAFWEKIRWGVVEADTELATPANEGSVNNTRLSVSKEIFFRNPMLRRLKAPMLRKSKRIQKSFNTTCHLLPQLITYLNILPPILFENRKGGKHILLAISSAKASFK